MKKNILIGFCLIFFPVLILYLSRWSFRNDEGAIGKITNALFNLNTMSVKTEFNELKIVWSGKKESGEKIESVVYKNGVADVAGLKNLYGPQAFTIYVNGKFVKAFVYMKSSWSHTYDYNFAVFKDSIAVTTRPYLSIDEVKSRYRVIKTI